MKDSAYPREGELNPFYGKTHSQETKNKISKVQSVPVVMLNLNNEELKEFSSVRLAAEYIINNCSVKSSSVSTISSRITKVVRGEAKTAYGYKWIKKCID